MRDNNLPLIIAFTGFLILMNQANSTGNAFKKITGDRILLSSSTGTHISTPKVFQRSEDGTFSRLIFPDTQQQKSVERSTERILNSSVDSPKLKTPAQARQLESSSGGITMTPESPITLEDAAIARPGSLSSENAPAPLSVGDVNITGTTTPFGTPATSATTTPLGIPQTSGTTTPMGDPSKTGTTSPFGGTSISGTTSPSLSAPPSNTTNSPALSTGAVQSTPAQTSGSRSLGRSK